MATRRTVDLGTVGFGLVPDTKALEQSLRTLKAFGQQVNQTANSFGWTDPLFKKLTSIEGVLTTLHAQVSRTTARMREAGVAAAEINKVDQAYKRLTKTLTDQASVLGRHEIARGVTGMRSIISQGNRLASVQEANKMTVAFRDLERAAILAVGPLSGVGARLAVMASLFENNSAKMALFIGGVVGVTAGMSLLAAASIRAVMEQERFDAQLLTATGSLALVGREYQNVLQLSNQLGQNVRTLVDPYAKFATAARLSNLPLKEQKSIFEGAITAGTAMRLSNERMGLVFLALEQMVSKGTVSMEELRRQLGDLLPGSIALAAQAMGVSEDKMIKMIENGEVLARDLLPKLAEQWKVAFGPAAVQAASSLQAETNRLSTSTFELQKRFDQATGFSKLWRESIVATRQVLDFLATNMEKVVGIFGAFAGAGAGLLVFSLFSRLPAVIAATASALRTMAAAVIALDLATMASGWGAILSILAKIALVAGGAAMGYAALKREMDPVTTATTTWIEQTQQWLDLQDKMKKSHRQTTDEMKQGTMERIQAIVMEIGATENSILARAMAVGSTQDSLAAARAVMSRKGGMRVIPADQTALPVDPEIKAMQEKLDALNKMRTELETLVGRINKVAVAPGGTGATEPGTQWVTWAEKIKKAVRDFEGLNRQIAAAEAGKAAIQQAEGLTRAIELMADQPTKGRGSILALSEHLRKAGIEGSNLQEQMSKLYTLIEQRKEALKELENFPEKFKTASDAVSKMFEDVKAKTEAARSSDPEEMRNKEQLAVKVVTLTEKLKEMRLTQEQINDQVALFKKLWGEMTEAEKASKSIKDLRQDIDKLNNSLGDRSTRAEEQFRDRISKISEAYSKNVIDAQEAARMTDLAHSDMTRQIVDRTTVFGKSVREVFRDVENTAAKAFAQIVVTGKFSIRDLFESLAMAIAEFAAKVAFIQPIMRGLFGGMYTGKSGDMGAGLFEGFLRGMGGFAGPRVGAGIGPIGNIGFTGGPDAFSMGAFASGGSFTVPGSGGTDSSFVGFHATPGERVTVETPGQQRGGITVNVINQSGVQVEAQTSQPRLEGDTLVFDLVLRKLSKDAGARDQLKSMLTSPRH